MNKKYELFFGRVKKYDWSTDDNKKEICAIKVAVCDRDSGKILTKRVVVKGKQLEQCCGLELGLGIFVEGQSQIKFIKNKIGESCSMEEVTAWAVGVTQIFSEVKI